MSKRRRKRKRSGKPVSRRSKSSSPVPVDPKESGGPSSELPTDQQSAVADRAEGQIQVATAAAFSGPLPHPEHFQAYQDTLSGAADRILTMAESSKSIVIRSNRSG